jgi:tetratricopeptide (TPR) repeat protein
LFIDGILLLSVTLLVLKYARRLPYLAVGWFWYLITLTPVIGLVQIGLQARADRYTYIPLIGIFLMAVWGFPDILARFRYRTLAAAVAGLSVIVACAVLSWFQIGYWKSSEVLLAHAIGVTRDNEWAHSHLAAEMLKAGRTDEAISHYNEALKIDPNYLIANISIASLYLEKDELDDAIRHFNAVLSTADDSPYGLAYRYSAHMGLGMAMAKQKRVSEAIRHFIAASQIQPDSVHAQTFLRDALAEKARLESNIRDLEKLSQRSPDDMEILKKLSVLYSLVGEDDRSISYLMRMQRIRPDNPDVYYNLACVFSRRGNIAEAHGYLLQALEKGFQDWNLIRKDPDLANLRRSPLMNDIVKRQ